jgi:hypothetical protein
MKQRTGAIVVHAEEILHDIHHSDYQVLECKKQVVCGDGVEIPGTMV